MDMQAKSNPYKPGTGTRPPYLAGRENEKSELEQALVRINDKPDKHGSLDGVSPPLVLIGPRGVGKTAMIGWVDRKAKDMGVRCAFINEKKLSGPVNALAKTVLGKKSFDKAVEKGTYKISVGLPDMLGAGKEVSRSTAVLSLEDIVSQQLEHGPLLLVLDEAHAVAPELLQEYCVAIQEFVLRDRPLALVLAGTPGLEGKLMEIGATFMERATFLPLNLLSTDEAREALSVPAARTGVPMDEDALEALVGWTDCYPYFIQLAGEESWKIAMGRGASAITLADAKEALVMAEQRRRRFYYRRYRALLEEKLTQHALRAIELIEAAPDKSIEYEKLILGIQGANRDMDFDQTVTVVKTLRGHGFIIDTKERFEAGIPSLFDYVKEKAAA